MLKISAVYLIGKAEIPIHYTTLSQVEQAQQIKITLFGSLVVLTLSTRGPIKSL